jgi:hypothetical protein
LRAAAAFALCAAGPAAFARSARWLELRSAAPPQDRLGRTALHWAVEAGQQEAAETLLDFGINAAVTDCIGRWAHGARPPDSARCLPAPP